MNRRDFLIMSLFGCGVGSFPTIAANKVRFSQSPFLLGVASGDPTHHSVVLWTRLVRDASKSDGGMKPVTYNVNWNVATDPAMKNIIARGCRQASPQLAHSVHVDLEDLAPDTQYWYQFSVGTYKSKIGKTKTLIAPTSNQQVRFITASCQNFTHGYFVAYQHMLNDKPDFIIFLGDYIYDTSFGKSVRKHDSENAPKSIDEYRIRHAHYKTDVDLQNIHANIPFFSVPDNHDALTDNNPEKYQQRMAAYQAWYEHMPVRGYTSIGANQFDIHRQIQCGNLMNINLLDTRQYRDTEKLPDNNKNLSYGFGSYRKLSKAYYDNERSMLGKKQEQWLFDSIAANKSNWQVIASSGPFMPFSFHREGEILRYIGSWDGYPLAQKRLIDVIKSTRKNNNIILSGDVHSFFAWDGSQYMNKLDNIPMVEFTTSSITADWPTALSQPIEDNLDINTQVKLYDSLLRGYIYHEVTEQSWVATMKAVTNVTVNNAGVVVRAKFRVDNGKSRLIQEV